MPRVPSYDNFSVTPGAIPQARAQASRYIDTAGQQAQEVGQGMMRAGSAASSIAMDIQNDANRVRWQDATTQAQSVAMDLKGEFSQLKGKDAFDRKDDKGTARPLDVEYTEKLDKRLSEIRDGLGNDAQKAMFDQSAGQIRGNLIQAAKAHTINQFSAYKQETYTGAISQDRQRAALNWNNPNERDNALSGMRTNVGELYKGHPPEFVQAKTVEAMTPAHAAVVAQAVQANDFGFARNYLAAHGDEMSPEVKANLEKSVQINNAQVEGESRARDLISQAGGGWSEKDVDKKLVDMYGNDPQKLEFARREMKYQHGLREEKKADYEKSMLGPVQTALGDATIEGRTITQDETIALTAKLKLDPAKYQQAVEAIWQHNQRIAAFKTKNDQAAKTLRGEKLYAEMIYNPDQLRTLDVPLLVSQGAISKEYADKLADKQARLRTGKLDEFTIQNDKTVIDNVLMNAYGKEKASEIPVEDKLAFYSRFDQEVNAAEKDGKITQTQKQEIARGLLTKVPGKVLGVIPWSSKRTFQATIDDVPEQAQRDIVAKFMARGVTPTPQMILEYYTEAANAK